MTTLPIYITKQDDEITFYLTLAGDDYILSFNYNKKVKRYCRFNRIQESFRTQRELKQYIIDLFKDSTEKKIIFKTKQGV